MNILPLHARLELMADELATLLTLASPPPPSGGPLGVLRQIASALAGLEQTTRERANRPPCGLEHVEHLALAASALRAAAQLQPTRDALERAHRQALALLEQPPLSERELLAGLLAELPWVVVLALELADPPEGAPRPARSRQELGDWLIDVLAARALYGAALTFDPPTPNPDA
jgi:hypothetical protein